MFPCPCPKKLHVKRIGSSDGEVLFGDGLGVLGQSLPTAVSIKDKDCDGSLDPRLSSLDITDV